MISEATEFCFLKPEDLNHQLFQFRKPS